MPVDRTTAMSLKNHFYRMLTNNVTWEFMDQIEAWKDFIDNLADAQLAAVKSVSTTLQAGGAEIEAEKQKAFALSMLVLNLVTGYALSWLGAMIQTRWAPVFGAETKTVVATKMITLKSAMDKEFGGKYSSLLALPVRVTQKVDADPTLVQLSGDIGKSVAGLLIDFGLKAVMTPPPTPPDTKFADISGANHWQSYKTGLTQALYDQQVQGQGNIRQIANAIENDVQAGEKLAEALIKEQPNLLDASAVDQEIAGQAMINKNINKMREGWANEWFYFGNDPPKVNVSMDEIFETEMWAAWILETDPHVAIVTTWVPMLMSDGNAGKSYSTSDYELVNGELLTTDAVLQHLFDLQVPVPMGLLNLKGNYKEPKPEEIANFFKNWAKNHLPKLRPKDFGLPRLNPISIEQYAQATTTYRQAASPVPV
jgi:hypothetical protein